MSGVPSAGLPQGYPAPPQQESPSGLVPQHQVGPYMYGRSNQQNRPDLNPLNSRPAMMVKNMARKRLNEYLRMQGLNPFQEHEEIPALFVLIELMHMTLEPLRTDANRAFRDMPVKVSTSRTVRTVWRRQPYEAVPYEARTFPFHVARMLLQQVENYSYTIYPELVQQGNMTMWKARPLNNEDVIQVAPVKWREPNERELQAMNAMANRLQQSQGIASRRQGGQGRLLVSLNPQQDQPINAKAVTESPGNPDVKTFQNAPQQVHQQEKPTPDYPDPPSTQAGPPPDAAQQYQNTPQGQQVQQPQQPGPQPQMQVDPQAPAQQAGQSTSMKSDLHDPLEDGKEIPETVNRVHQGKEPTADENQEALATGQIDPEVAKERQAAVDNAVNQAAGTNNPPPPKPETKAPPPPPPPPATR